MPRKKSKSTYTSKFPSFVSVGDFITAVMLSYFACTALGLILTSNLNVFVLIFYFFFFWYGYLAVALILYAGSLLISKKINDRLLFLIVSIIFLYGLSLIPVPPGILSLIGPLFVVIVRALQMKN